MTPTQHPEPAEVVGLTEGHRDSYPMGNIHHGTEERPDWGTFCLECKQSWPCDVSRLADRLADLEAERDTARREADDLRWAEMLTHQECAAKKHPDWFIDSEHNLTCPWCAIDDLRARLGAVEAEPIIAFIPAIRQFVPATAEAGDLDTCIVCGDGECGGDCPDALYVVRQVMEAFDSADDRQWWADYFADDGIEIRAALADPAAGMTEKAEENA